MRAGRPLAAYAAATARAAHAPRCLTGCADDSRGGVRHGKQYGRARLPRFAERSLGSWSQRALGSGSKGAGLTQGLQVSIRQSSRGQYLVDKPSHDTNLVGKSHRRGKGCVVGMGGGLGVVPASRQTGPSVTLAVAVL